MNKYFIIALVMSGTVSFNAYAYSGGCCEDCVCTWDATTQTLSVTPKPENYFDGRYLNSSDATALGDLSGVSLSIEGFDGVGSEAFVSSQISALKIGDNMDIEAEAFMGNDYLTDIIIGNECSIGFDICEGCVAVQNITIGDNAYVGEMAFNDAGRPLQKVIIGEGGYIGESAFWDPVKIWLSEDTEIDDNFVYDTELFNYSKDEDGFYHDVDSDDVFLSVQDMISGDTCGDLQECQATLLSNKGLCAYSDCYDFLGNYEDGDQIKMNGKMYASLSDLFSGNAIEREIKRIYTVDEANAVAGDKNRVRIRYK